MDSMVRFEAFVATCSFSKAARIFSKQSRFEESNQ